MATQFDRDRLAATLVLIEALEAALTALITDGAQSYTLDTGQSRQVVTKLNVASLQKQLDTLYNRYDIFNNRCNGGGTLIARPTW
jgi:hypothetical protein